MKIQGTLIAILIGFLAILFFVTSRNHKQEFEIFKSKFGKIYSNEQNQFRRSIFNINLQKIKSHNLNQTATYKLGITPFADMDFEQFNHKMLTKIELLSDQIHSIQKLQNFAPLPGRIDWRQSGAVTEVKNQKDCRSGWAFAATGAMEGAYKIAHEQLPNYSQQQLIDCIKTLNGCIQGTPQDGLKYIATNGIVSQKSYPYFGWPSTCQVTQGQKILANPPYSFVAFNNVQDLRHAVTKKPVAVAVDASNWSLYKSGVFDNCNSFTNHYALLIGYDIFDNWIVKNSWGSQWGESGYIQIYATNTCGISNRCLVANIK